jgi:uncharacterized protein (TIGR00297 family)
MYFLHGWQIALIHLVPIIGLTLALAFFAWGMRSVTGAGAMAGVFLTAVLCLAAGAGALLPICTLFLFTIASTRMGRRKKERFGTAERGHGRNAPQIFANLGVAAMCAAPLIFVDHPYHLLLAGASAALGEAAGDTVSSELGQVLGGRPRLVTTLRRVSPGVDGGITVAGTAFSFAAAALVCLTCEWAGLLLPRFYWPVVCCAFFGTVLDSLLGATLERPDRLGNNAVNFTSSAFSAFVAIAALFFQY